MNREGQIDEDAHKLDEDGVQPVGHLVLQAPTNRNSARNVEWTSFSHHGTESVDTTKLRANSNGVPQER